MDVDDYLKFKYEKREYKITKTFEQADIARYEVKKC